MKIGDADYTAAGKQVATMRRHFREQKYVLGVQGPAAEALAGVAPGAWLVAQR